MGDIGLFKHKEISTKSFAVAYEKQSLDEPRLEFWETYEC
ncbi:hypothetical protein Ga0074115_12620 [endosymbiont of Ridgeia piscesae]|jgi:hypothetical protein|uniref:Uncharacterized protein n=1 Tax=endosymbiont of Ridgeia piscesae TaxID=54398 RepID=A0A0T5YZF1_9GAMM|nr:hypothetical protein Ga0074115_12620 [endosymbiont of Ridgeia piscesae]KRT59741.1 hypothetical protein Ga0076813_15979 [endosymbiont of Ridgeia piscesae]